MTLATMHRPAIIRVTDPDTGQSYDADADSYCYPVITDTGIRCAGCQARHENVAAVRACHAITEDHRLQQEAEIYAENGWLRAAEAGTPDTWRDEELARMAEASGLPVPPGFW